jgi:phage/plasmid-like protein (TIGR03299 family)
MLVPAKDWRANIREDTGDVLGIVGDDYKIVQNHEAFAWLNELLYGELQIETAGSLHSGKRVWVLAKVPEMMEVGGDPTALYVYCANSHDGSMAVTASSTRIRIVCANTLGWALRQADGAGAQRTYKFRHAGDMQAKLGEARQAMQIVLKWDEAFKSLGDELARQEIGVQRFDKKVVQSLLGLDDPELTDRMRQNREENREIIVNTFQGKGPEGDTAGNSPGTKWTAANAVAEFADWNRRYTKTTDQMQRSFEDQTLKQRGLDLVIAA